MTLHTQKKEIEPHSKAKVMMKNVKQQQQKMNIFDSVVAVVVLVWATFANCSEATSCWILQLPKNRLYHLPHLGKQTRKLTNKSAEQKLVLAASEDRGRTRNDDEIVVVPSQVGRLLLSKPHKFRMHSHSIVSKSLCQRQLFYLDYLSKAENCSQNFQLKYREMSLSNNHNQSHWQHFQSL